MFSNKWWDQEKIFFMSFFFFKVVSLISKCFHFAVMQACLQLIADSKSDIQQKGKSMFHDL